MIQLKKTAQKSALPLALALCAGLFCALSARADDLTSAPTPPAQAADQAAPSNEDWAVHGQATNITQKHSVLTSPYSGTNSLSPNGRIEETTDLTLFSGVRVWRGAEFWLNTEIDQGFGFDDTLGMAGFPNGGAYKVGENNPYVRIPRAFIRQVFPLGGAEQKVAAAANQLGSTQTADNVTLTVGKFAVVDIFDTNSYAHDPRADFMNWAIIEGGAFDYAADSWGYTYGAAAEWTQSWWTLRAGFFQLSTIPNGKVAGIDFSENSVIVEAEGRYQWQDHPGKIKLLAFENHGSMGSYADAVRLGIQTASAPDTALVRQVGTRPGMVVNWEQELSADLGAFARYSVNRGDKETYEFTDINHSLSAGVLLKGDRWGRHEDAVGVAVVSNRLSGAAQAYFGAGGMGVTVGDGRLNYASEQILEAFYSMRVQAHLAVTLDYQYVTNPAYNQDRGPVSIFGVRLHADF